MIQMNVNIEGRCVLSSNEFVLKFLASSDTTKRILAFSLAHYYGLDATYSDRIEQSLVHDSPPIRKNPLTFVQASARLVKGKVVLGHRILMW